MRVQNTATASAETDVTLRAEILFYSRARGLFAGISLEGSTLRPDYGANKNLCGKEVSAKSIVFDKAGPVPTRAKDGGRFSVAGDMDANAVYRDFGPLFISFPLSYRHLSS